MESRVAAHAKGKVYVDQLFGTGMAAKQAIIQYGKENVIDASMGTIADDDGNTVCLPAVEELFRSMPIQDMISYSPVAGLPGFLKAAVTHTFAESRPDAYIRAVASAGGAGAISNVIWNYSNAGDTILTHDWYWTPYETICKETGRHLMTFSFLDADMTFNLTSFSLMVSHLLVKQDHVMIILNSPNHNPTGYSMSDHEWDEIIKHLVLESAKKSSKTITLLIDIAYIDFTKDPAKARTFMKKFSNLPSNIIVAFAFSMSKGFTVYGQRTGAVVGVSSSKSVAEEFENAILVTSRSRWSNVNRGCMTLLSAIYNDKMLLNKVNAEREAYQTLIAKRAEVFINEAQQIGLSILPYHAGFFITIPCSHPDEASKMLAAQNIFTAPLSKGIRIAACSVPLAQMHGLAAKIKHAITGTEAVK
ncbi:MULTISPECIES: pyridoxal phosphate-dependent aminotransferase [Bacillus]|uniref:Aminotransferase class I/II-fold pyridoxal phosphate-dependent enzyme n=1 Tax=Bacillus rugosus TaxID=2715209 RepID=A0ACD3ZYW0_9BACI|nr:MULTISPECIES: aminotransferase class I/II-fold pyridoxal phosphate-dependent enzyme [Bacillus]MBY4603111.1 aminotransferase class I/II-fold pyridoxal phosphate-dependent enzyme [Bacillus sp. SPARC3]UPV79183.1 aminotransferase class I/II-fold pyridoxal phosphate-dependent enzyme [Bacillus rugosus]